MSLVVYAACGGGSSSPDAREIDATSGDAKLLDAQTIDAPPDANLTSVFQSDSSTLALLELNGDVLDASGYGRSPTLVGGTFVATSWGMGLQLPGVDPQGLDWSAYAALLTPPYTVEMVVTPDSVGCYAKLFGADDADDKGWYYCDGLLAYNGNLPSSPLLTDAGITALTRHYLALVSADAATVDVYFQGVKIGSVAPPSPALPPPSGAVLFRDDSSESRGETLKGVVEAVRISSVSRTSTEIAAVQAHLATRL